MQLLVIKKIKYKKSFLIIAFLKYINKIYNILSFMSEKNK